MTRTIIFTAVLAIATSLSAFAKEGTEKSKGKPAKTESKKESKGKMVKGLPGGLKAEITQEGKGAVAEKGKTVSVHYTGWLQEDGKKGSKFDSSVDRGQPFEFALGAGMVIKGWDEGVAGMKIGEKRTLTIPSEMGYGSQGAGGAIPPNATLLFDVELLGVK